MRRTPVLLGATGLLGIVWFLCFYQSGRDRAEAIAAAIERNEHLAVAFQQFTARTIQAADTVTRYVKAEAERHGAATAIEAFSTSGALHETLLQGVGIIDESGILIATTMPGDPSETDYSDREHFRVHAGQATDSVFVGKPVISKRLGVGTIPITRRIQKSDGSFGGVVVAQFNPSRFAELFREADLRGDNFISVAGFDGIIRMRRAGTRETFGEDYRNSKLFRELAQNPSSGSYTAKGFIDGTQRFLSYRTLPKYELVVTVGVSEAEVLAGAERSRILYIWVAGSITVLIVGFALSLLLSLSRSDGAARRLLASEESLQLALHAGCMVAWRIDLLTGHVARSENAQSVLGLGSGPISDFYARVHAADRPKLSDYLHNLQDEPANAEIRYDGPRGDLRWLGLKGQRIDHGTLVGVTVDITDRKAVEQETWRLANHDPLTGLPNRLHFQRRFEEALNSAKLNGTTVNLMLLDLDDFKEVNDGLGHDVGDALLQEVATRLRAVLREGDVVARIGGDEFGMLMTEPLENATRLAEHLIERLAEPFRLEGRSLATKASIGVAAYPDHDDQIAGLMKDADVALYRAKSEGRNRALAYRPEMRAQMEERARLLGEVREALKADQFVPFYQPKLDIETGEVVGFEALARWQHPQRGLLTPGVFGVAFQDVEIADAIGEQMIRKVAGDVRSWRAEGLDCPVAVNVASAEFRNPGLADFVLSVWEEAGLPPHALEIEVTETVFLGSGALHVKSNLRRFRERGVRLALDDFGTGYASLAHLKDFDVDHIKIDQSFVRGLLDSPHDQAIVSAVIALGASFGMDVTAEGVETAKHATRLKELGCRYAQGYLYAKPLAASRVPWFLRSRARPVPAPARLIA